MNRTDLIRMLVVAVVGLVGVGAIEVLTLLGAREWTKFAVLAVTFVAILLGAYSFVLVSDNRR